MRIGRKSLTGFFATDFPKGQIVKLPPVVPATPPPDWPKDAPKLNARGWNHILYGEVKDARFITDARGYKGAHLTGYDWISKHTPFPSNWDKERIKSEILLALTHPEKKREYSYIKRTDGGILKVIVKNGEIASAYIDERLTHVDLL